MLRRVIRPVGTAPSGHKVVLAHADETLRRFWDQNIQPHIDRIDSVAEAALFAKKQIAPDDPHNEALRQLRADARWRWSGANISTQLAMILGTSSRQDPMRYALCVVLPEGLVPVGMLLLAERFFWPEQDPLVFVWYLSTAPDEALINFGVKQLRGTGSILIDHAVCRSFFLGFDGRVLLHAAERGGDSLVAWYQGLGFRRVPKEQEISTFRTPFNDGRYMHLDSESAAALIEKYDSRRT
ncbi:MAG: hypothetical protein ACOZQL_19875 [Myxococcota bacterium]